MTEPTLTITRAEAHDIWETIDKGSAEYMSQILWRKLCRFVIECAEQEAVKASWANAKANADDVVK